MGERLLIDLEAWEIFPATEFLGRVARAAPESVLFECWSSGANLVRCDGLLLDGDFTPTSLVTTPAFDMVVISLFPVVRA